VGTLSGEDMDGDNDDIVVCTVAFAGCTRDLVGKLSGDDVDGDNDDIVVCTVAFTGRTVSIDVVAVWVVCKTGVVVDGRCTRVSVTTVSFPRVG